MIPIDIDQFTEQELHDLNRRIVERIRFFQTARTHQAMLKFNLGDRVCFQPEGYSVLTGTITRYNKKSVSVVLDCGHKWTVAPAMMWRSESQTAHATTTHTTTVKQVAQPALLPL